MVSYLRLITPYYLTLTVNGPLKVFTFPCKSLSSIPCIDKTSGSLAHLLWSPFTGESALQPVSWLSLWEPQSIGRSHELKNAVAFGIRWIWECHFYKICISFVVYPINTRFPLSVFSWLTRDNLERKNRIVELFLKIIVQWLRTLILCL